MLQIDVAIPQFPDVEFAIDDMSFGLCFRTRVIPCRIAEPGDKFDVFHRDPGLIHHGPVQRGLQRGEIDPINEESPGEDGGCASGRPDGAEQSHADDEEKTRAAVILLRHEDGAESGKRQAGQGAFPVAGRDLQELAEPEEIDISVEAPVCLVVLDKSGAVAHEPQAEQALVLRFVQDIGRLNRGR